MRLAGLVAIALVASADAAPPAPVWSDWVGDYAGKLAWTGCAAPGVKSATLALDAIDGALSIDLTPAGGGLRAQTLVEDTDRATLTAQDGELSITVRHRAAAIEIDLALTSGCTMHGTLARATSKVTACDRLVALARIQAACTKLPAPAAAFVAKKWKAADATACGSRADAMQSELVDAGCYPVADAGLTPEAAQCRQLISEAERIKRCANAPREVAQIADQLIAGAAPGSRSCRAGHELLVQLAAQVRCPL